MYLMLSDEKILMEELELLQDGTYRIGNSFYCEFDEAILLIRNRKAKLASASIGVTPDWADGKE